MVVLVLSSHLPVDTFGRLWVGGHGLREQDAMPMIRHLAAKFSQSQEGQGLAEYALILALIAVVAIVALLFLGAQVSTILSNVGNSV